MWQDLLAAVALVFVIEGILPFLFPRRLRESLMMISRASDASLRVIGLVSMCVGLLLLYSVR